jgi:hypothetical protein
VDWQPIATAPRDGTEIVIWLGGDQQRWVKAFFRYNMLFGETWDFEDGHSVSVNDDVKWWMPTTVIGPPPK